MNKQVVIIEPGAVTANVFSGQGVYPLMGPLYLGAVLRQAGHSVRVINENLLGRPVSLQELDADVACISALTPTADRAYEIARQHKAIRPKGLTLLGGVHPSFLPEEAARFADHVVVGEGEDVIADLIAHGASETIVQGKRIRDLDRLPIPDLTMLHGAARVPRAPIMTSRGCPHQCNFCSVTAMFGHAYRMHSVERVLEELRRVRHDYVFFYDDNFVASPTRTRNLLQAMLRANIRKRWTAQVRVDVARDQDLVALMARSGCTRVYVGLESIDDNALKAMNKRQTLQDIVHAVETFHRFGIAVHGMFILGSDEDPPGLAQATVRFCRRLRMDSVQFLILTPFPGTPVFERLASEGRLLHRRWSYYDGMHAVFEPATITAEELQNQMVAAFEDFYSLLGAVNDGLNIIWEGAHALLAHRARLLSGYNALTKLGARRVIRRWLDANQDYLRWLAGLGRARLI